MATFEEKGEPTKVANQTNVVSCLFTSLLPYHWDKLGSHYDQRGHSDCIKKMCRPCTRTHACTHTQILPLSLWHTLTHTHIYTHTPLSLSLSLSSSMVVTGCVQWELRTCYLFLPDLLSISIQNSLIHLRTGQPIHSMLAIFKLWNSQGPGQVQREKQRAEMAPPPEVLKLFDWTGAQKSEPEMWTHQLFSVNQ